MIGGAERGYPQLAQAQGDVREVYRGGFVGQLVSGAVWLLAAAAGTWLSAGAAVIVLWVGGVLIFPLTSWCLRLSGRPAALPGGHPMAALATQIAFTVPPGMLVAVALAQYRPEWFLQLRPPGQPGAPPAGPSKPDVDQPRPDLLRACANSDRARGVERGTGHQLVAGQRMGHLVWCGPPRELPRTHIAGVDKRYRRGSQQGQESTRSHDHSLWCACSKEPGLKDPEVRGESSPVTRSTTAPYLFRPRPQRDNRHRTDTSAVRASPAAKRATSRLPATGRINVSRPSECVQMRRGVGPQGVRRTVSNDTAGCRIGPRSGALPLQPQGLVIPAGAVRRASVEQAFQ